MIDYWGDIDSKYKNEFIDNQNNLIDKVINVYMDMEKTNSDIGNIVLDYYKYIENFKDKVIPTNIVIEDSQLFNIPFLINQYFTYMPIRAITSVTSNQYKFKKYQTTDERGYRKYKNAYCIALGTYFGKEIGSLYSLTFEDGNVIQGVLTDIKSDIHTDSTHRYSESSLVFDGSKGNIVEFVMDDEISSLTDLSYSDKMERINNIIAEDFPSPIIKIEKVGKINVMF